MMHPVNIKINEPSPPLHPNEHLSETNKAITSINKWLIITITTNLSPKLWAPPAKNDKGTYFYDQ